MQIQPYLFFEGRCEEAIEFYRRTLGAEVVMMMRFKECPVPTETGPEMQDKVMHATLRIGESVVMLSDGRCQTPAKFQGFALSIPVASDAEADRVFAALSQGGQVQMPLNKTFFASKFGMVTDRFGVMWMILAGSQG